MNTEVPHTRHWLGLAWITTFLVGTDLFIVAPLLPSIARDMQELPESLTVLVSVFSLAYAIASPIFGRLARRSGLSRQLRFGVFILAAANVYTALAPSVIQLVCSRIVAGLGAASITPVLYALAAERASADKRGHALAVVSSGLVLALAAGAPLGLVLGGIFNWRLVFGGLGVALLTSLPVHQMVWSAKLPHAAELRGHLAHSTESVGIERLLDAWPLLLGMILWAMSVYGTYTLIGTAFQDALGWPLSTVAAMLMCFGVGATAGSLSGGKLADRFGANFVIRWNFALSSVALLMAAWAYTADSPWAMGSALLVTAFLAYGIFPALQARVAEQFHFLRPVLLGLMSSALYVGITLGAFAGANIYQRAGMFHVLIDSACLAMAGHLLAWWLKSRQKQCASDGGVVQPVQ